jgi:hypothetical protein
MSKGLKKRTGVLRISEPRERTLAQRPDNRWCEHCKRWIHKDLLTPHLKKKHGIASEKPVTHGEKNASIATSQRAARPQSVVKVPDQGKVRSLGPDTAQKPSKNTGLSGKITPKKKKAIELAFRNQREKMKELFRKIDRKNFPPGSRLTSNASGRSDKGGGFMSNRKKH